MKICFVIDEDIYRPAGVQYYILDIAENLITKGHSVTVLCSENAFVKEHEINPKIDVKFIAKGMDVSFFKANGGVSVFPGFANRKQIREILNKNKFDVFHFNYPFSPFISARVISEIAKHPTAQSANRVATFHVYVEEQPFLRFANKILAMLQKKAIKNIKHFISTGDATDFYGEKYLGVESIRIPIGIKSVKNFKKNNNKKRTILFLGRLQPRKGVIEFITALSRIPKKILKDTKIIIAGDGPQREEAESLARQHNLEIDFKGAVHEEKHALYKEADIAVFPTLYGETFGIVLLEAMNYKCITLGYSNMGYKGTLAGLAEKSLVEPGDIETLSKNIAETLRMPDKQLQRLQQEYKSFFEKHYNMKVVIKKLIDLYED